MTLTPCDLKTSSKPETLRAGQEVLHAAILRRGQPDQLYVDNGAAYAGHELARSCAVLGIRLIHSRPYAPQGRSKLERLNRVIQRGHHRAADPELLRSAFLWAARRRVSRTATVSLLGNQYQVDRALLGRQVELRYRPEDLSQLEVWFGNRQFGFAIAMVVERHVHPQLPAPPGPVPQPTGVDYLGQVLAEHRGQ